jgi:hypothetical protein
VLAENGQPSQNTASWWRLCSHEVYLGMMVGGSRCVWHTVRCVWLRDCRCKGCKGA